MDIDRKQFADRVAELIRNDGDLVKRVSVTHDRTYSIIETDRFELLVDDPENDRDNSGVDDIG